MLFSQQCLFKGMLRKNGMEWIDMLDMLDRLDMLDIGCWIGFRETLSLCAFVAKNLIHK
jgi:hypothetical protein